jgi:hypothetical protein
VTRKLEVPGLSSQIPLPPGTKEDLEMMKSTKVRLINPNALSELAQEALQEASNIKNPYLSALMSRFGLIALKLKTGLETERKV